MTHGRPIEGLSARQAQRFWNKVTPGDGCWGWRGVLSSGGYGRFKIDTHEYAAHRVAYTLAKGDIPDGLVLDHLCRNRACVNPEHLEPVTQRTNVLRGVAAPAINAKKTHCDNGHPFEGHNLIAVPNGGRMCRTCNRQYMREYMRTYKKAS